MRVRPTPFVLLAASVLAQAPDKPAAPVPPAAMATIQRQELLEHATFLAADELGGRLTGSPGQLAAADYIAAHFQKLGLQPLGDEIDGKRSWRQEYGIARTAVAESTRLVVGSVTMTHGFAVLGGKTCKHQIAGTLRFCGTGRTRGESADVPETESLDGRIAVVALKGPRGKVAEQLGIEQKFAMSFGTFNQLGRTAKTLAKKGAAAVLFVQTEDKNGLSDVLNYLALAPGKDSLAARFDGADSGMGGLAQMLGGGDGDGAPSLVLSVPASQQLLGELGITAEALAAFVAGGERPAAKADVAARLDLEVVHDDTAKACNVVGLLRGSDPQLAAEAVVYSAHMDHVGMRIDGEVFNGADDNASGSAGLLAIARAFAASKDRPRRSVIFLSVSGEELGLWGSAYFADNPTWPADRIVANVNTDMIGRNGPESGPAEVTVTPSHRHAMFSTIVQDAARFGETLGLAFTSGDKYYQRSDHYNFAKKGIPVVFFCNGEHEDYHQVSDHADKLDGEKMEKIARLAFWTGWAVANADERPHKLGKRAAWN
ncbi:MAG: M20/M25/M40 family metallo-hydrolase [Planctomycetota bacterium]